MIVTEQQIIEACAIIHFQLLASDDVDLPAPLPWERYIRNAAAAVSVMHDLGFDEPGFVAWREELGKVVMARVTHHFNSVGCEVN